MFFILVLSPCGHSPTAYIRIRMLVCAWRCVGCVLSATVLAHCAVTHLSAFSAVSAATSVYVGAAAPATADAGKVPLIVTSGNADG